MNENINFAEIYEQTRGTVAHQPQVQNMVDELSFKVAVMLNDSGAHNYIAPSADLDSIAGNRSLFDTEAEQVGAVKSELGRLDANSLSENDFKKVADYLEDVKGTASNYGAGMKAMANMAVGKVQNQYRDIADYLLPEGQENALAEQAVLQR